MGLVESVGALVELTSVEELDTLIKVRLSLMRRGRGRLLLSRGGVVLSVSDYEQLKRNMN